MRCPQCNHEIPIHQGFPSWCEQCDWNVLPQSVQQPKMMLERFKARLDQRFSQHLFSEFKNRAELQARWTLNRVLTVCLALLVHATTLGLLGLGLWGLFLWVTGKIFLIQGIGSLFALILAITVSPRIEPFPRQGIVSRQDAPRLHELVEQIARAVGFQKPVVLAFDGQFNASFARLGWRQRPVVMIGLPLFWALEPQEQVALLAHELAHGVNGDATRGFIVWSAVNTISRWQSLFDPDVDFGEQGFVAVVRYIFYPVMWLVNRFLALLTVLLAALSWRDSQRAEYLADVLAAQVAGLPGKRGLLKKLHYQSTFEDVLQRYTIAGSQGDIFTALRDTMRNVPERELQRIERVWAKTQARLDTTHPPTTYRVALLEARVHSQAAVSLSEADAEALQLELKPWKSPISQQMVSQRRDLMYAG